MGRHPNRHHPISIHAPRGGATTAGGYLRPSTANFNPPAHVGQDQSAHHAGLRRRGFNPRAPRGRDTYSPFGPMFRQIFQPTCPVGRDDDSAGFRVKVVISIHAPRRARRRMARRSTSLSMDFNPRAPCGAGRGGERLWGKQRKISIHLPRVGQDRPTCNGPPTARRDFNPPAPCGAGRGQLSPQADAGAISIHLPRVGQDCFWASRSPETS